MNNSNNTTNKKFFIGVLALTIGNLFVKLLGLALKVPLRNMLTDEGMNYYNTAYDIYAMLFTFSTTGLPSAISMMISECRAQGLHRKEKKVFVVSTLAFVAVGFVGTAVMIFGAPLFALGYKITDLEFAIMAVAPTMLFICVASSFRGYFQGYQSMTPTAVSEIIEACGKFALGIIFGRYALSKGYSIPVVAAYAALGISIGVAFGMISLFIVKAFFKAEKNGLDNSIPDDGIYKSSSILKNLFSIAIPISLANSVTSIAAVVDGMILSQRLQSTGFTESEASTLIGNYKTCAMPLYNLPLAFVGPITASVIPVLMMAIINKDKKKERDIVSGSLLMMSLIELPCTLGLCMMSSQVIQLLFGINSGAEKGAPLLSVLSISVILNAMYSMTVTILHTYQKMKETIASLVVAAIVKMIAIYTLAGIRSVNIYAAPISTFIGLATSVIINLVLIRKCTGFHPNYIKIFLKPGISAFVCAAAARFVYYLVSPYSGLKIGVCIAIAAAAVVYAILIVAIQAFDENDIMLLPAGSKIAGFLKKHNLLKENQQ